MVIEKIGRKKETRREEAEEGLTLKYLKAG